MRISRNGRSYTRSDRIQGIGSAKKVFLILCNMEERRNMDNDNYSKFECERLSGGVGWCGRRSDYILGSGAVCRGGEVA